MTLTRLYLYTISCYFLPIKYLTVSTVVPQLVLRLSLAQSILPIPLYLCLAWARALFSETLKTLTIAFTVLSTHVE
jgi:hypothetical protein